MWLDATMPPFSLPSFLFFPHLHISPVSLSKMTRVSNCYGWHHRWCQLFESTKHDKRELFFLHPSTYKQSKKFLCLIFFSTDYSLYQLRKYQIKSRDKIFWKDHFITDEHSQEGNGISQRWSDARQKSFLSMDVWQIPTSVGRIMSVILPVFLIQMSLSARKLTERLVLPQQQDWKRTWKRLKIVNAFREDSTSKFPLLRRLRRDKVKVFGFLNLWNVWRVSPILSIPKGSKAPNLSSCQTCHACLAYDKRQGLSLTP